MSENTNKLKLYADRNISSSFLKSIYLTYQKVQKQDHENWTDKDSMMFIETDSFVSVLNAPVVAIQSWSTFLDEYFISTGIMFNNFPAVARTEKVKVNFHSERIKFQDEVHKCLEEIANKNILEKTKKISKIFFDDEFPTDGQEFEALRHMITLRNEIVHMKFEVSKTEKLQGPIKYLRDKEIIGPETPGHQYPWTYEILHPGLVRWSYNTIIDLHNVYRKQFEHYPEKFKKIMQSTPPFIYCDLIGMDNLKGFGSKIS